MLIELAGKGLRLTENMYDSFGEAVEDLYNYITFNIRCSNYAIFGHSMGSTLAYELAKKITYNNIQLPSHLFLSGRNAPQKSNKNRQKSSKTIKTHQKPLKTPQKRSKTLKNTSKPRQNHQKSPLRSTSFPPPEGRGGKEANRAPGDTAVGAA